MTRWLQTKVRLLADGEVERWNLITRRQWAEAKHKAVLEGKALMPSGIGLHKCTREQLMEDE